MLGVLRFEHFRCNPCVFVVFYSYQFYSKAHKYLHTPGRCGFEPHESGVKVITDATIKIINYQLLVLRVVNYQLCVKEDSGETKTS